MVKWKYNTNKVIIDHNADPRGWFRVMMHTVDVRNHRANRVKNHDLPPLTVEKGEMGYITLLIVFYFNEYILYQ